MIKQLERAETSGARRAVVQLAAVLGVIQALRKVEQRIEWRSKRLKRVEVSHEWLILDAGAMALFWVSSSLGPCAIKETYDESFQELSMATGLLAWLVWDVAIDVKAAVERTKPMDLEHEDEPCIRFGSSLRLRRIFQGIRMLETYLGAQQPRRY